MKRLLMLTALVGVLFGALTSVSAEPVQQVTAVQYFVRWVGPITYSCHVAPAVPTLLELQLQPPKAEYFVPASALMKEQKFYNTLTNGGTPLEAVPFTTGIHAYPGVYNFISLPNPVTFKMRLTTYVNGRAVYESTLVAICDGNKTNATAQIVNVVNPVTAVGPQQEITTYP